MSDAELRAIEHELRASPDAVDVHERRARLLLRLGRNVEAAGSLDLAVRLGAKRLEGELGALLDSLAVRDERVHATFRLIPGGPFLMGDDRGDEDERPRHLVRLDPFYVADQVVHTPYEDWSEKPRDIARRMFRREGKYAADGTVGGAASFDWRVANELLDELGKLSGIVHRMPTEAEWERVHAGMRASLPYRVQIGPWYEFVSDHYDSTAYDHERGASGTRTNPRGPSAGLHRVVRGASAANQNVPFVERSSWRDSASESRRMPEDGVFGTTDRGSIIWIHFRIVRPVTP